MEKERSISISQKEYRPRALRRCIKAQPAPNHRLRPNNSDLTALAFALQNPIIASATHKHTRTDTRAHTQLCLYSVLRSAESSHRQALRRLAGSIRRSHGSFHTVSPSGWTCGISATPTLDVLFCCFCFLLRQFLRGKCVIF